MQQSASRSRASGRAALSLGLLWALTGVPAHRAHSAPLDGSELTFVVGSAHGLPGTQVLIPIQVYEFTNIISCQFSLHWPTASGAFVDVEQFGLAGLARGNFGTTETDSGTLTLSWDDLTGLTQSVPDGTVLFFLRLQIIGPIGSTNTVSIDGDPTPIEVANGDLAIVLTTNVPGQFSIDQPNRPPTLDPINDATVDEANSLTFTATATDPDLPPQTLLYSLQAGAPAGAAIDPHTGVFTWTPTEAQGPSTNLVTIQVTDDGSPPLSNSVTVTIRVNEVNTAPALAPIPDRTIEDGTLTSFTVAATDADLPPQHLTYTLDPGAPPGAAIDPGTGQFTWSPTEEQVLSTNLITVRVTDDGSPPLDDTQSFTIMVSIANTPPTLSIIGNKKVDRGNLLIFTARAIDPDRPAQSLSFSLDPGAPAGAAIDLVTGTFSWLATPAQGPGVYPVTIRVTDNGSPPMSDAGTITITVADVNTPPLVAAIADQTIDEGVPLVFTVVATDTNTPAQTLTYSLDPVAPAGASLNATTGAFSWTPTEAQGPSTNLVTVRVTDNGSPQLSTARSFTIVVNEVNSPPVLTAIPDQTVNEGVLVTFTAGGTDSDIPTQTLRYSLDAGAPTGAVINASSGVFAWTPSEAQGPSTNLITVRVTDNGSPPASASRSFTVIVNEVNSPPVLAAIPDQTVNEGVLVSFTARGTDSDIPAQTLSYSLDPGAPTGAVINASSGVFAWTPSEAQGPSTNLITVRVTDNSSPPASATRSFTIIVNEVNSPPLLAAIPDQAVDEGVLLTFTADGSDLDIPAQTLSYSLDPGAPTGAVINASSGVFAWTPSEAQGPSTNPITVRVTDNGSPPASATRSFTVIVNEVNSPPVLGAIADQTVNEGVALTFTASGTDSDIPAQILTYSLAAGAPTGAFINPVTGHFSWTPAEAQGPSTNLITVRVTDNGSPPASATRSLTVIVNEVNSPPALTAIPDQAVNEGVLVTFIAGGTDSDLPAQTLSYSLDPGAPTGAVINASSGLFSWTPAEAQGPSTNLITVRVTDNGSPPASAARSFTVIVNEVNSSPVLAAIPDQAVDEGVLVSFTASGTDSDIPAQTLSYSLGPGAPTGAVINASSGVFAWTPSEAQGPSTNPITVRVTDNGSPPASGSRTFTIIVNEVNSTPVLAAIPDQAVNEGVLVSFTASGTDSDIPAQTLSYSLDAGAPTGAVINTSSGLFSWTPAEAQGPSTNLITVRVTDNGSPPASATRTFTIIVNEVNSAPVLAAIADQAVNEGVLVSFTADGTDSDIPAQTLSYSLDPGAPTGAVINASSGVFAWTPYEAQGPSTNLITVRVTDNGSPPANATRTFTIIVNEVNSAPVLAAIADQAVNEGVLVSFTANGTDSDIPAQTLSYSLDAGAPTGAVIDASSGLFSWTPAEAQGPSTNLITVRVTDNGSPPASATRTFTVIVNEVNSPPVLAAIPDQTITEGSLLTLVLTATDSDLPAQNLAWRLDTGAPAGAAINPTNGLFTWTPPEAPLPGTNRIGVIVADSGVPSLSATQMFTVMVLKTNSPPVFAPLGDFLAQVLVPLHVTNVVMDPDLPPDQLTFQLVDGPKGIRINKYTGVVTWAPAKSQARTTNIISLLVSDDGDPPLSATNSFQVIVDDYLELSLGRTVVMAGQSGSVLISATNTSALTNITALLFTAGSRLSNLSLTSLAPELGVATLEPIAAGVAKLSFGTTAGQFLQPGETLARLQFTAAGADSVFVPLILSNLVGYETNGVALRRTLATPGHVTIVGSAPLLEAVPAGRLQPTFLLYGLPGTTYLIQSATDPFAAATNWQTVGQATLTDLSQQIRPPAGPGQFMFYRVLRQN